MPYAVAYTSRHKEFSLKIRSHINVFKKTQVNMHTPFWCAYPNIFSEAIEIS